MSLLFIIRFTINNNNNNSFILEMGANVNAKGYNDAAPIHIVSGIQNAEELLITLIKHGANLESKTDDGATPLICARKIPSMTKILIQNGANVNYYCGDAGVLTSAMLDGDCEVVEMILDAGADIDGTHQMVSLHFELLFIMDIWTKCYYWQREEHILILLIIL